ncbi:14-3-3 domain-containing protein [Mycena leptocephala]|nr:14-3-3 domain-containing protein [Mycena leptocephala]
MERARVQQATLMNSCGLYQDTLEILRPVAYSGQELTLDERRLFATACGIMVKRLRHSCKIISLIESHKDVRGRKAGMTTEYRQHVEAELFAKCKDILQILEDHLIPSAQSNESLVFYRKMMGDFYRYLAEFSIEFERRNHIEQSLAAYTVASHLATHDPEMPPTHPTRLGLAINFSILYHDILENPDEALEHANQAFSDGIRHFDLLTEETYKESILLLQLLKDNSTLWSRETA